jgi:purine catabolism regulator
MHKRIGVKVSEILEQDYFKDARIICGHGGVDRYITGVNVMEVPDIVDWIKPTEFLLTTAYSIKDDLLKLNELIPVMKKVGVAGLGIKTKRYVDDLPKSVLDTANALDFPVIQLPLEMSFGDIISQVLTFVVNKQTNMLIQIDEFNSRLKAIMLKDGNLNEIALMINEVVSAPVAITDNVFKDYTIASDNSDTHHFNKIIERLLNKKSAKFSHNLEKLAIYYEEDMIAGNPIRRVMIPIYTHNILYGNVIIWDVNNKISESMLFVIESAISLIALNSSKKMSVYENENKHKIEFIEELLSDQESRQLQAVEKAAYFNFDISNAYGVMMTSINKEHTEIVRTPNNAEMQKQLNSKLIRVVERLHRQYKGEMIYGNKSDRVVFLMGFDHSMNKGEMKDKLIKLSDDFLSCARMENMHNKLSIGLGRIYSDYKDLHKSYHEAKKAIQKIDLNKGTKNVIHFDELGLFRILSCDEIQPELQQFFIEALGPIVAYDREKNADLLETLKKYYECGCSLKKVSEEMFTHYNTVIYRIQRIKEIGNIDFSDPNVSLNIHIALKILDVINLDNIKIENDER